MSEIGVILFLRDERQRQRFQLALTRAGIVLQPADRTLTVPCDLIVADQLDLSALPEPLRAAQTRGDIGLIQIGTLCGGDVVLPTDCSARELVLACRLMAEIVRLRRSTRRQRDARRAWQRLAERDPLTNIPNRRTWNRSFAARLAAVNSHSQFTVVLLDVDQFKRINDELGHAAGDAALQAVADVLRRSLRSGDLAARLGGDEFAVLLMNADPGAVHSVVERIRRAAGEAASAAIGQPVSLSAGCAQAISNRSSEVMNAADLALRQAKLDGRDTTRMRSVRESA